MTGQTVSRRNLTSNKRAFGKNPKAFLDKVTEAPLSVTINDGVNPEYTIKINPTTAKVTNSESLPGSVSVDTSRDLSEFDTQYQ